MPKPRFAQDPPGLPAQEAKVIILRIPKGMHTLRPGLAHKPHQALGALG